ncbi:hypothetical protein V8G54_010439 [Vigna mungo]|uniref:RRM domain-containing protein n=1 Tax=Vigna mungo TaxID=3915 RepID=A0AAQ3NYV6_VIGMU
MENAKVVSTPLATHFKLSVKQSPSNEVEKIAMSKVPYAFAVGSLMYAMVCTRPDIAHVVGTVSRFLSNPGREHWNAVKWILRYIRGTSGLKLCFGGDKPTLVGYSDSDMAGDIDSRKSTSGYLIQFVGGDYWECKCESKEWCQSFIWLGSYLIGVCISPVNLLHDRPNSGIRADDEYNDPISKVFLAKGSRGSVPMWKGLTLEGEIVGNASASPSPTLDRNEKGFYRKPSALPARYHSSTQRRVQRDSEALTLLKEKMRPIFCGNLDFDARQSDVERLFRRYGKVDRVDMKSAGRFDVSQMSVFSCKEACRLALHSEWRCLRMWIMLENPESIDSSMIYHPKLSTVTSLLN